MAPAFVEPAHFANNIACKRAAGDQLFRNASEQPVQHLAAAGQQAVGMAALWYTAPILASGREDVAIHQRHTVIVIREKHELPTVRPCFGQSQRRDYGPVSTSLRPTSRN